LGTPLIADICQRKARYEDPMHRVGLASFIYGTGLYIVPAPPFPVGGPLHLRVHIFTSGLARQHREHAMAGTISTIYWCEEPLPIREICIMYHILPARNRWGQNDRSVARPPKYFFRGTSAIGSPSRHSAVCCHATGYQSAYSSLLLGQLEAGHENLALVLFLLAFRVVYLLPATFLCGPVMVSFILIGCRVECDK
jgi:hypothetical protein